MSSAMFRAIDFASGASCPVGCICACARDGRHRASDAASMGNHDLFCLFIFASYVIERQHSAKTIVRLEARRQLAGIRKRVAIPGMPHGKPAGVRCAQLDGDNRCAVFGQPERPQFCGGLKPSQEMCGSSREQALTFLARLEQATQPGI